MLHFLLNIRDPCFDWWSAHRK